MAAAGSNQGRSQTALPALRRVRRGTIHRASRSNRRTPMAHFHWLLPSAGMATMTARVCWNHRSPINWKTRISKTAFPTRCFSARMISHWKRHAVPRPSTSTLGHGSKRTTRPPTMATILNDLLASADRDPRWPLVPRIHRLQSRISCSQQPSRRRPIRARRPQRSIVVDID